MEQKPSWESRNSLKHINKYPGRHYARIDTVQCCPNGKGILASPPLPRKNQSSQLYRGENTHSSSKLGSIRARNETDSWSKGHPNQPQPPPDRPQFFEKQPTRKQNSVDTKGRSARSFMIRKKNNSNYSKKQQVSIPYEAIKVNKMAMGQIYQNSKQLTRKGFGEQSSINPCERQTKLIPKQKPKSVYAPQSQHDDSNPFSGKPVVCREYKKMVKAIENEIEEMIPSIEKLTVEEVLPVTEIMKKMMKDLSQKSMESEAEEKRVGSRSISKDKKIAQFGRQEKQNKHHKHRTYTGCKTIRLPWQTQGTYFNQLQNMQTKKPQKKCTEQSIPLFQEQQQFGGISMIPQMKGGGLSRRNSRLESLQELVIELQNKEEGESIKIISQDFII